MPWIIYSRDFRFYWYITLPRLKGSAGNQEYFSIVSKWWIEPLDIHTFNVNSEYAFEGFSLLHCYFTSYRGDTLNVKGLFVRYNEDYNNEQYIEVEIYKSYDGRCLFLMVNAMFS